MYLTGIYGPPDPPMREALRLWRNRGLYSFAFWAFDQFCLNSRPVPLEVVAQSSSTLVSYRRPRAARSPEAPLAVAYAPEPSSRLNTFRLNARKPNSDG